MADIEAKIVEFSRNLFWWWLKNPDLHTHMHTHTHTVVAVVIFKDLGSLGGLSWISLTGLSWISGISCKIVLDFLF
jgi:hypothetical protein